MSESRDIPGSAPGGLLLSNTWVRDGANGFELDHFIERFKIHLAEHGHKPSTLKSYSQAVRLLCQYFEKTGQGPTVREISADDVRSFNVHLLRSYATSSAYGYAVGIRRFFVFLESRGVINASPARNVAPPKFLQRPAGILQKRELKALLRACRGDSFLASRDMALFRVFMATGARVSEVLGLKLDQYGDTSGFLELKAGTVKLEDSNGHPRRLALDPRTVKSLQKYLRVRSIHKKSALTNLWITKWGGLSRSGIYDLVGNRTAKAGIEGFRLHMLRTTFAYRWINGGGNHGDLMRVMGLRSRKMIDRYAERVTADHSIRSARIFHRR